MTSCVHLYLAELFLKCEMFQSKRIERMKTNILYSITFRRNSCVLWDNVEKYGRARQVINAVWSTRLACWIIKATDKTHSVNIIRIAFPRQQWGGEGASVLRLYVYCPSILSLLSGLPDKLHSHFTSAETTFAMHNARNRNSDIWTVRPNNIQCNIFIVTDFDAILLATE